MAVTLTLTDGAAQWLDDHIKKMQSDHHWSRQKPSTDEVLYTNEIARSLGGQLQNARDQRWEGPGNR